MRQAQYREGDAAQGQGAGLNRFGGANVLIVEDDFIVAFEMQNLLEEQGANVLGPAATLEEARQILTSERPELAVLDVNLNGEFVFPLVRDLQQRRIPFLFTTAYADDDRLFPESMQSAPRIAKPVMANVLIAQLKRMLDRD